MISDALWKVFEATGHIGAYLLYKDYRELDQEALDCRASNRKMAGNSRGE